jgi:hypothetical protein
VTVSDRHDADSAERVAALIAPVIDRLRNAMVQSIMAHQADLAGDLGVGMAGGLTMGMLRNALPRRPVTRQQLRTVLRYMPPDQVDAGADEAVAAGLIEGDGALVVTDRGREYLDRLYGLGSTFVVERWSGHEDRVERLLELTGGVLHAALETGGPAFAVMAPPYEPPGAPASMRLAERLTPLRFHRFDAHVAAWEGEGLTVAEVQSLGAGPLRARIEEETNRRSAPPYAAVDPGERIELLGGLGALPN